MIKAKRYLTTLLIFVLCISLASCGFARYIRYENQATKQIFEDTLAQKLQMIDILATIDICQESALSEYRTALLDAKNELNECETLAELDEVWAKHMNEIVFITVGSLVNMDDYREGEQAEINEIAMDYIEELGNVTDTSELVSLFRELEIEIYSVKTADELYADELSDLKSQLHRELYELPIFSEYAIQEIESIETLISDYKQAINSATAKDTANALFEEYAKDLSAIETKKELELKLKNEALIFWKGTLEEFKDKHSASLQNDISELLSQMRDTDSPRLICLMGCEFIIDESSRIGNDALADIADIAYLYLESMISQDDYRKEQKEQIVDLIETAEYELVSAVNIAAAKEILSEAKDSILSLPTSDELWKNEDNEFFETLNSLYGDQILDTPEKMYEASSYEELSAIIDYYAFYQTSNTEFLRDTFRVKLLYPYKTPIWEKNEVYWYCELIRSAVGISGYYEKTSSGDYFVITLIPYALSTNTNAEDGPIKVDRYESLIDFDQPSNGSLTPREEDFDDFAYLTKNTKALGGVWNTQQLWYALQHGYLPDIVEGSPAEKTLQRAKDILREIINEGMTDEEKIYAIFNWFSENVIFDDDYTKYLYPEDRNAFPDELAATLASFHAEGALFDNLAVCEGFAKAMLIMLRIEGIESYRIFIHGYSENVINNLGYNGYGSHALVAIKMSDGKFYISDPYESYQHNTRYPKLHQFLIPWELHTTYVGSWSQIFKDLVWGETILPSVMNSMVYNGNSVFVRSESELLTLLDDFKNETRSDISVSVFEYDVRTDEELNVTEKLLELGIDYHKVTYKGLTEYILYKD